MKNLVNDALVCSRGQTSQSARGGMRAACLEIIGIEPIRMGVIPLNFQIKKGKREYLIIQSLVGVWMSMFIDYCLIDDGS